MAVTCRCVPISYGQPFLPACRLSRLHFLHFFLVLFRMFVRDNASPRQSLFPAAHTRTCETLLLRADVCLASSEQIRVNSPPLLQTIHAHEYEESCVEGAHTVLSAGGDGTFLLASSGITSADVPLIGKLAYALM